MSLYSKTHAERPRTLLARIRCIDAALRTGMALNRRDERGLYAVARLITRKKELVSAFIAGKGVEVHYESK